MTIEMDAAGKEYHRLNELARRDFLLAMDRAEPGAATEAAMQSNRTRLDAINRMTAEELLESAAKWDAQKAASPGLPRVPVYVSGGVAEYVADDGVEVVVFDQDNYDDAPDETDKVPAHFADLAETLHAPVESEENVQGGDTGFVVGAESAVSPQTGNSSAPLNGQVALAGVAPDLSPIPPGVVRILHLQEEGRLQKGDVLATAENGRCTVAYIRSHNAVVACNERGRMVELCGLNFGADAAVVDRAHDRPRG